MLNNEKCCLWQILLRKLVSDVEEENSRLTNTNLSLEESCEEVNLTFMFLILWYLCFADFHLSFISFCVCNPIQLNSNICDKSNDLKQLREQIRKLEEQLDSDMQVLTLHSLSTKLKMTTHLLHILFVSFFFFLLFLLKNRPYD